MNRTIQVSRATCFLVAAISTSACGDDINAQQGNVPFGAAGSAAFYPGAMPSSAASGTFNASPGVGGAGGGLGVASSQAGGGQGSAAGVTQQPGVASGPVDVKSDPSLTEALPQASAGPLVLRRLSPQEYSNTLFDLLGDTTEPGSQLPNEGNTESGFAVVESASTVSVSVFLENAERLAQTTQLDASCGLGVQEEQCATDFITDFGRRAFRRPVKTSELENLLALFDRARELEFTAEESLRHVASAMLQSSGFLYLWEEGEIPPAAEDGLIPLTPHQIASRLSYMIWGTMPDEELASAADNGALATPEQIRVQAERLLSNTERTTSVLRDFHVQWLHLENLDDLVKDQSLFPVFTEEVRAGLMVELEAFVSGVLLEGTGTSRELLTASNTFANGPLAELYGATQPLPGFSELALDPAQRSGLLTQAAFLAANANITASNPPRRGKVVWEKLFCGSMPPVPANVPAVQPPAENLTTRQRFEVHSEDPCAAGCHGILDPLGFAFENYDAVGGYRVTENNLPVDASGVLTTPAGGQIAFNNAVELMAQMAESYEVDRCFATSWARFMLSRKEVDADLAAIEGAYRAAGAGPTTDFSIRDFIVQFVQSTAFRFRAPTAG